MNIDKIPNVLAAYFKHTNHTFLPVFTDTPRVIHSPFEQ